MCDLAPSQCEFSAFNVEMRGHVKRAEQVVPDGALLLLGDSIVQASGTWWLNGIVVNLGIGGDTTLGVLQRLKFYDLERASGLVLSVGVNDLGRRSVSEIAANMVEILNHLPSDLPVLMLAVLPVDPDVADMPGGNALIGQLNSAYADICGTREYCAYLDPGRLMQDQNGNLRASLHEGDGVHLNADGYALWISVVRDALSPNLDSDPDQGRLRR